MLAVIQQLFLEGLLTERQGARNSGKNSRVKVPCPQGPHIQCHERSICRARRPSRDGEGMVF